MPDRSWLIGKWLPTGVPGSIACAGSTDQSQQKLKVFGSSFGMNCLIPNPLSDNAEICFKKKTGHSFK